MLTRLALGPDNPVAVAVAVAVVVVVVGPASGSCQNNNGQKVQRASISATRAY